MQQCQWHSKLAMPPQTETAAGAAQSARQQQRAEQGAKSTVIRLNNLNVTCSSASGIQSCVATSDTETAAGLGQSARQHKQHTHDSLGDSIQEMVGSEDGCSACCIYGCVTTADTDQRLIWHSLQGGTMNRACIEVRRHHTKSAGGELRHCWQHSWHALVWFLAGSPPAGETSRKQANVPCCNNLSSLEAPEPTQIAHLAADFEATW
jgi:hypothetical protein